VSETTQKPAGLLQSAIAALSGRKEAKPEAPGADPQLPPVLAKIRALRQERAKLHQAAKEERDRAAGLSEQLKKLDKDRAAALLDARLNGGPAAAQRAAELGAQSAAAERERADAEVVAEGIDQRIQEIGAQIDGLAGDYLAVLSERLNAMYVDAMARYNEVAPAAAAAIVRVAAIRRAMIELGAGNSNGWSGEAFLPGMSPGAGAHIPPLLAAGSGEFDRAASAHKATVLGELYAAGFSGGRKSL
jgi:hypothetical protein